jgi:hypothetical protein
MPYLQVLSDSLLFTIATIETLPRWSAIDTRCERLHDLLSVLHSTRRCLKLNSRLKSLFNRWYDPRRGLLTISRATLDNKKLRSFCRGVTRMDNTMRPDTPTLSPALDSRLTSTPPRQLAFTPVAPHYSERAHACFQYEDYRLSSAHTFVLIVESVRGPFFSLDMRLRGTDEGVAFRAFEVPTHILIMVSHDGLVGLELCNTRRSLANACGIKLRDVYEMLWKRYFERKHCTLCLLDTDYVHCRNSPLRHDEADEPCELFIAADTSWFSGFDTHEAKFEHQVVSRVLLNDAHQEVCSACYGHSLKRAPGYCTICLSDTRYYYQLRSCKHQYCGVCLRRHWQAWHGMEELPVDDDDRMSLPARCPMCAEWFTMRPETVVEDVSYGAQHRTADKLAALDRAHQQRSLDEYRPWQLDEERKNDEIDDFDALAQEDNLGVNISQLQHDRHVMQAQRFLLEIFTTPASAIRSVPETPRLVPQTPLTAPPPLPSSRPRPLPQLVDSDPDTEEEEIEG